MVFGNDYLFSLSAGELVDPKKVVKQIMKDLQILVNFGAKHILMNTLPYLTIGELAKLTKSFKVHNRELKKSIKRFLESHDVTIELIEVDKEFSKFTSKRFQEETGITKGFDPCIPLQAEQVNKNSVVCDEPEKFIFFDNNGHITTKVHEFFASLILGLLTY